MNRKLIKFLEDKHQEVTHHARITLWECRQKMQDWKTLRLQRIELEKLLKFVKKNPSQGG